MQAALKSLLACVGLADAPAALHDPDPHDDLEALLQPLPEAPSRLAALAAFRFARPSTRAHARTLEEC